MNPLQKHRGFTLTELLIVLSLLTILITLIYPNYSNFIYQTRRSDAVIALTKAQILLEQCYGQNSSYAQCSSLFPKASPQSFYWIEISNLSPSTYTLTASPQSTQKDDLVCAFFSIDQSNVKTAFNALSQKQDECWRS